MVECKCIYIFQQNGNTDKCDTKQKSKVNEAEAKQFRDWSKIVFYLVSLSNLPVYISVHLTNIYVSERKKERNQIA